jgi:ATP-dependent helicase/nuclease subunit A
LLALCDTLLLPEDDLSLACVLTSPLGELADDDLMALAIGREGSLWSALRQRRHERPNWARAAGFIEALLARVDYVAPHALLVEALGPLGARARLLGRLGPEAAEPLDELLGAAIAYAAAHPPSLQGFIHWLRQAGAEVKRQAEEAGRSVRVMTVHGAKGLQAPLVILPDTTSLPPEGGGLVWDGDVPLWSPRAELRCAAVSRLKEAGQQARMEEYNRLLYVALTRAEDRLLVCGWQTRRDVPEKSWYESVRRGMQALGAGEQALTQIGDPWDGPVLVHDVPQLVPPRASVAAKDTGPLALPTWIGGPPGWRPHTAPTEPPRPVPLAPSRPSDVMLGPVPHAASPVAGDGGALERGRLIHELLQHAPNLPIEERPDAIARTLKAASAPAGLLQEVMGIIDHPALAPLFGPQGRAEQPLSGLMHGTVVSGIVDRMAVLPDSVLVADYKTNRDAPARPEDTPVLYLRQMAAYRAVLSAIFPGRAVLCHLVWTRSATVMRLPDGLLDAHAPGQLDPAPYQAHFSSRSAGEVA